MISRFANETDLFVFAQIGGPISMLNEMFPMEDYMVNCLTYPEAVSYTHLDVYKRQAYKYVFSGAASVVRAYGVTILVTVVGTALHLLFMSMLAYALTREEVIARNKISFLVYIPVLFNGGLVPYYMLMTRYLHLKNTIWVLILVQLVSAVNVLIMKNFFRTIPKSLIESARIDGSGEFRTFFSIVLPLSTPSLASIG